MSNQTHPPSPLNLEVVKGKNPGRLYPLGRGAFVLGNALNGSSGIDLSDQEANSPRRMSARQAQIDSSNGSPVIRDLNSPGGTFVNRERLLPGVDRRLAAGDLIQLGSVQLRVVVAEVAPVSPAVKPSSVASFLFALKTGAVCRSWDDFLSVSAQRWNDLRDELTSGRLAGFLASIGRQDLAPNPQTPGTPDERLDAWIGGLPTTQPATPELEVHPRTIRVQTLTAGGSTRRKIQISNTGYRLLKVSPRVEPTGIAWLRIVGQGPHPLVTIDALELTIEIDLPEDTALPRTAEIQFQSNGGSQKVEIRVEKAAPLMGHDPLPQAVENRSLGLKAWLARYSVRSRLFGCVVVTVGLRLAMAIADFLLPGSNQPPGLLGAALLLATSGVLLGGILAWRCGQARDVPAAALTGGVLGMMLASILVATGRVFEPLVGGWVVLAAGLWGLAGAAFALLSAWVVPARHQPTEPSR